MHSKHHSFIACVAVSATIAVGSFGTAVAGAHEDANAADRRGDFATELRILQPQAALGQAWAENNLGELYLFGDGVQESHETALFWFNKAAAQNDKGGKINLGQMYEHGGAVHINLIEAAKLYREGGAQGDPLGWSLLKRLCNNTRRLPTASCAGIPASTVSVPVHDLAGHPEVVRALIADFAVIIFALIALFFTIYAIRSQKSVPNNAATAIRRLPPAVQFAISAIGIACGFAGRFLMADGHPPVWQLMLAVLCWIISLAALSVFFIARRRPPKTEGPADLPEVSSPGSPSTSRSQMVVTHIASLFALVCLGGLATLAEWTGWVAAAGAIGYAAWRTRQVSKSGKTQALGLPHYFMAVLGGSFIFEGIGFVAAMLLRAK